jgi:DNA-binding winged helix-turn-helix (wHTH) protein/tetratricopeptide (TPR) repeat protein
MDQIRAGDWFYGRRAAAPVELAHADRIAIGGLEIDPGLRRVAAGGRSERLEPRVMQLLVALARADGAILSRDDLLEACWDGRAVSDDAINRVISRLRKTLAALSAGAVGIETIPRVGYRLVVGAGVERADAPPAEGKRPPWRAAAVAAVAAGGAALLWAATPFGERAEAAATITIQPVTAATRNAEEARFVNDLTSDFARAAEAISSLNLVDAQAPGRTLRPDFVVRIAVDREGGNLAAQARLVSGSDGSVLWSRDFADARGSLGALREQVAVAAAGVMRCGLERTATTVRDDPATARLFFAACDAAQGSDWATASSFARQVVARRPDVAAGWGCLAMTSLYGSYDLPATAAAERARQRDGARRYAEKAIALDPRSGRAYIALAQVEAEHGDFARQLATLERGLAADPELTDLHNAYSTALFNAGYVAASVAPALRSLALNPTSRSVSTAAVRRLLAAGRTTDAFAVLAQEERTWPDHPEIVAQRIWLTGLYGDPKAALALIERRTRQTGHPPGLLPFARDIIAWRADPATLDRARLSREAETNFAAEPASAWFSAMVMNRLGDTALGTAWMLRAPVVEAANQWSALFWPDGAALRRDPRFFAAMARIGLVDLWRARGQWPDFCSDPGLAYDCRVEARKYPRRATPA